ncbi:MAG: hypothetical protein IIW85_02620 [Bacteroidaceae bacterium]|nr:hypothetical protein [Bacteroidaceae bacterium]
MNKRKSYFLIAILLIAVTTGFVSCKGGGAKGAAAAAGAKIIHEAVESFEEDEPGVSGSNVSFKGSAQGSCNIPSHGCKGFVNNGDNYCLSCGYPNVKCHKVYH